MISTNQHGKMAGRGSATSADASQEDFFSELEDELFLPFQWKPGPGFGGQLIPPAASSSSSSEWVDLPLESSETGPAVVQRPAAAAAALVASTSSSSTGHIVESSSNCHPTLSLNPSSSSSSSSNRAAVKSPLSGQPLSLHDLRAKLHHGHGGRIIDDDGHSYSCSAGSDSEPTPAPPVGAGLGLGLGGGGGARVRVIGTFSLDDSDNNSEATSPASGAGSPTAKGAAAGGGALGPLSSLGDSPSILDGLLCEIYDRCQLGARYSVDSDGFTEYSSNSEGAYLSSKGDSFQESTRLPRATLNAKSVNELQTTVRDLQHSVAVLSGRLIKQLKRRDRYVAKLNKNQDVLTAVLQAVSQKRRVDARLKFSIEPLPGKRAFRQWYDALRAVARLPKGLPKEFRKSVWLSLANRHIKHLKLDWPKTVKFTFNDRSNPDDDTLGVQIVKDLHRTGCSGFCGQDAEDDRVVLKRVLLAYARWNKAVGYCQGFNVLAALILEVMERIEDDALKVMIFLIDHVLPDSYFANNLRALSVDMAVFRELLHFKMPELAQHLDRLQKSNNDSLPGSYEPPLTNVFTMQWFLTLFATCLPKPLVLRVWDSIFLEGSEILLRVALSIWAKLGDTLMAVESADEFYSTMGHLGNKMLRGEIIDGDELIQTIYNLAPFPFPHLNEIREKYMFSITPFSPLGSLPDKAEGGVKGGAKGVAGVSGGGGVSGVGGGVGASGAGHRGGKKGGGAKSDEEGEGDEDEIMLTCFTSLFPMPGSPTKGRLEGSETSAASLSDITRASPGAYGMGSGSEEAAAAGQRLSSAMLERMNMDIYALKRQYWRIQRRQQQAHVIYSGSVSKEEDRGRRRREPRKNLSAGLDSSSAINHLLIGKHGLSRKNRKSSVGTLTKAETSQTPPPPERDGASDSASSADRESRADTEDGDPGKSEDGHSQDSQGTGRDGIGAAEEEGKRKGTTTDVENEDEDSDDGGEEEEEEEEEEGARPAAEPPVGLLIDFGSPQHVESASGSSQRDPVAEDSSSDLGPEQNGPATPGESLGELAAPADSDTGEALGEGKAVREGKASQPPAASANSGQQEAAVAATATNEATTKANPERQFNCAVEAYRPDFARPAVEGAGNPKMYGQSNAYRPWLAGPASAATAGSSSDSDPDWVEEGEEELSERHRAKAADTPSATPAYNPFPTRRLKSSADRTRTRNKVGLYKAGTERAADPKNGRCVSQQMGASGRAVKSGGRF